MKLRASGEDYLEAILVLQRQKGMVRSVDVARHLEVSKPSVNAFCVKCCRFRSDRSFHANKSSGLFTAHHLYFILGCATAHLNNHVNHVI